MLEARQLQCRRGDRELFADLSFQLVENQLMRLEGPNGSGKTTLLRTLCGLFLPDAGEVLWSGLSIKKQDDEYNRNLFYLGHQNAIKSDLTALENLRFNSCLGGDRVRENELMDALDKIGLFAFEDYPTRQLSQGQKRRVALARLLVSKAKLWILDEPFVALDVHAVDFLQDIIARHVDTGGMVILTTHQEVKLSSGEVVRISLGEANTADV